MAKKSSKEIIALSDYEHVLKRSTMYVGSIEPSEEKIPIIRDNKIIIENKIISVGFYKLFNEILDNSIDEAKRMDGKMKVIYINIDSKSNKVIIKDTGEGFYKGNKINAKTGLSNIDTAMTQLRAGSNFNNQDTGETLIGMNGVGASLVNMLSDYFSIDTRTKNYSYRKDWENFTEIYSKETKGTKNTGTTISFIPKKDIFKGAEWDLDIVKFLIILKRHQILLDPIINKLKIHFTYDDKSIDLSESFLPNNSYKINSNIGELIIWESFPGSTSISFVNTALCTGVHQKIINDYINEKLDDQLGHHFYETLLILNLPPKLIKFGDQNKTKFVSTRNTIESTIADNFLKGIKTFYNSSLFKSIKTKVLDRKKKDQISELKIAKRKQRVQFSHRYHPASGNKENLFIVEGLSAAGSILQKRDPRKDGVYALKGKIKNVRNLADLAVKEVVEIMKILDLDIEKENKCTYDRIIISTDADPDGYHICSLIINLFYKWFSYIIKNENLYIMCTPLLSVGEGKNRKYYYNLEEFQNKYKSNTSFRYLKGLGALDINDWEYIMNNKKLLKIKLDNESHVYMDIAFGSSSQKRKDWLKIDGKIK